MTVLFAMAKSSGSWGLHVQPLRTIAEEVLSMSSSPDLSKASPLNAPFYAVWLHRFLFALTILAWIAIGGVILVWRGEGEPTRLLDRGNLACYDWNRRST
jgi:hypothetical protein